MFKQPLKLHSTSPLTGYLRNGYCEVPAGDFGNHSVAVGFPFGKEDHQEL